MSSKSELDEFVSKLLYFIAESGYSLCCLRCGNYNIAVCKDDSDGTLIGYVGDKDE